MHFPPSLFSWNLSADSSQPCGDRKWCVLSSRRPRGTLWVWFVRTVLGTSGLARLPRPRSPRADTGGRGDAACDVGTECGGCGPLSFRATQPLRACPGLGQMTPELQPSLDRTSGTPSSGHVGVAWVPTSGVSPANRSSPQPARLAQNDPMCQVGKGRNALSYLGSLEPPASRSLLCRRAVLPALALPGAPAGLSVLESLGGGTHVSLSGTEASVQVLARGGGHRGRAWPSFQRGITPHSGALGVGQPCQRESSLHSPNLVPSSKQGCTEDP